MSNLPITFEDKENSPELLAFLSHYGETKYLKAEEINQFRDAINELFNANSGSGVTSNRIPEFIAQQIVFPIFFSWKFFGVEIVLQESFAINVPFATTGKHRQDLIVAENGVLIRIPGLEVALETPVFEPIYNSTTQLRITAFEVNEDNYGSLPTQNIGEVYLKKQEFSVFNVANSGQDVIVDLRANGAGFYNITAAQSVAGFSIDTIYSTQGALWPFENKSVIIYNATASNITLKHNLTSADIRLILDLETDLIVPPGKLVEFRYFLYGGGILKQYYKNFGVGDDIPASILQASLLEFQTLIAQSELQIGATYRVNGLDDNFCDGFFKAISVNKFNEKGFGLFQNPNYSMINLWTNQFYNGVTISVGIPALNEAYTNGTQSFIWKTEGLYIANQDNLPNGTYTSGAKSVIVNGADVWTYEINDHVIFGNKHWKNLNGNLGSKIDELNLDSEWEQVFTNLIPVIDDIIYDIDNDWISERKDSRGNEISLTKYQSDIVSGDNFNFVKTFNWGKIGSDNNKIINWFGVICNLNFEVYNNTGNIFFMFNNTGDVFQIFNNTGNNFQIFNNTGNGFNMRNNTGNNFFMFNNTGNNFQICSNAVHTLVISGQDLTNKTIEYCDLKNVEVNSLVNISTATILFGNYAKSVFRNSAQTQIITYYNENNVLVVANITD